MKNPFEYENSSLRTSKRKNLEWEESALNSKVGEVYDQDRVISNLLIPKFFIVFACLVILSRLFYLQILNGFEFRELSEKNRIRRQPILAPRGLVEDRYSKPLLVNVVSYNLVAIPFDIPKNSAFEQLNKISQFISIDISEAEKKVSAENPKSIEPIIIKSALSQDESIVFKTRASEFIGFSIQEIPIRMYDKPEAFSHLLGYTGQINSSEKKNLTGKYESYDFIGKLGLEQQYEKWLHGKNGSNLVEVDATGKILDVLGKDDPEPGYTLHLNIDKDLQEFLYKKLSANLSSKKAAAVAVNPKNGEVLALVSLPGYNNNLFSKGISQKDYTDLLNDKNLPLFNRAVSGTYPPGSTVKPVVALAALENKVVEESTIIYDNGVLVVPNQFDPTKNFNFNGWKRDGLGPVDVKKAIAVSSDIYFYTVAGGHYKSPIVGLGVKRLVDFYRIFFTGKIIGIDLPGEKSGLMPDPEWKSQYFKNNPVESKWYLGDTYHIGIGQGDLLTTPLQVVFWTSTIANSGVGYKPQIVSYISDKSGNKVFENKAEILVKDIASEKNIKIVQEGMRETVLSGSGRQLNTLKISSAGKTGTSQFDGSNPLLTHAWFTAYAPFEDPEIAITVLVEAGGEGNAVAVPVVKEVFQWWSENRWGKK